MKQLIFLSIIVILLNLVQTRYVSKDDNYYYIFVNNTLSNVSYGSNNQKRQNSQEFVTSVIQEIDKLIIENKDTYKNPEELLNIEKQNSSLLKRDDNTNSVFVKKITSVKNVTLLLSYLSYELKEKVENVDGVYGCEPNDIITLRIPTMKLASFSESPNVNSNNDTEFINNDNNDNDEIDNINSIKLETGWKDVEIRKNADLHLSLISQGIFNGTAEQYDTNYYYPKTAGEGIDIFFIDGGFNFRHPEFANNNQRITKCLIRYTDSSFVQPPSDDYCVGNNYHGEITADIAGGLIHGVANKANIYGIGIDVSEDGEIDPIGFIMALSFIYNYDIKPHKTIINLSVEMAYSIKYFKEFYVTEDLKFIEFVQYFFDELNEMGVVLVTSSGNQEMNVYDEKIDRLIFPCIFNGVICVGAIDNYSSNANRALPPFDELTKINYMDPKNYVRAYYSNYGNQVSIYAPGTVYAEYQENFKNTDIYASGTSYASPIISGVAAILMSEHSDIQFNSYLMLDYLNENGHKDSILDTKGGPNGFVNNGKKSIIFKSPQNNENDFESITSSVNEEFTESTIENATEGTSVIKSYPEIVTEGIDITEDVTENTYEDVTESVNTTENVAENAYEDVTESVNTTENVAENVIGNAVDNVTEYVTENVNGNVYEDDIVEVTVSNTDIDDDTDSEFNFNE